MATSFDVIVVGGGGAGLMCAAVAGARGRRVAVLDHAESLGKKLLISGGGRCNFTNRVVIPENYVSLNPHFCKSALARYTPEDFIALVEKHGIPYEERKWGQLFCRDSARRILDMLLAECRDAGVIIRMACPVRGIRKTDRFHLQTTLLDGIEGRPRQGKDRPSPGGGPPGPPLALESQGADVDVRAPENANIPGSPFGEFDCASLVIATGGLSVPSTGATGFGYDIARQFGLAIVDPVPALDGFTFSPDFLRFFEDLSGISIDVTVTCGGRTHRENLLITHRGLSGPAILQASLFWKPGEPVWIDLLPGVDIERWFKEERGRGLKLSWQNALAHFLPERFAERFADAYAPRARIAETPDAAIETFAKQLHAWEIRPAGTVGFHKAEVTRGGVDTRELSSKTMEAVKAPGLYFVGEVMDVTGMLGGFNFQWAWSSGFAAGQAV